MDFKKAKIAAVILLLSLIYFSQTVQSKSSGKLRVGYYRRTCPQAEIIVRRAVNKAVSRNPGLAAGLIRIHFHDCFIRGCDGSVLLNTVPGKPLAEKDSFVNNPSLRGFEIIDEAKAQIEAICPKTVSCSDILAFSARDSSLKVGQIGYDVPSGRKDGLISLSSEVLTNLPSPFQNAATLRDIFRSKGMSLDDMVTLSGAHSIGVSHCSSFSNRLSGFNTTLGQDPSMDPGYGSFLRKRCPVNSGNAAVNNDVLSPNRLDSKYYETLMIRKGLLTSDQTLFDSALTRRMVVDNARRRSSWARKFADAMVRMGNVGVLTGAQGEIRTNCNFVN